VGSVLGRAIRDGSLEHETRRDQICIPRLNSKVDGSKEFIALFVVATWLFEVITRIETPSQASVTKYVFMFLPRAKTSSSTGKEKFITTASIVLRSTAQMLRVLVRISYNSDSYTIR
jgi:hypothetical protein